MNANIMTSKIEMTKTEAIAAGRLNSDKFNELKTLREMFPAFQIEIVKNVTKKVDHFKGLTYEYMENYIKNLMTRKYLEYLAFKKKVEYKLNPNYGALKVATP